MIQLTLSGHLCADPRINETPSGAKVANLRVAGNYSAKNDDGEYEKQALFFDVELWRSVDAVAQYFFKGSGIEVAGELQERHWTDRDGTQRTNLVIRNAQWSFPPKSDGAGNGEAQPRQAKPAARQAQPAGVSPSDFADKDIPF